MHVSIFLLLCLRVHGFFVAGSDTVSVKEGNSVTLHTGIKMNHEDYFMWYFNKNFIAAITGDLSYICTDVQCKDDDDRFRDRLQLDHQTGSLTIINTRTTDSGLYELQITSGNNSVSISSINSFIVIVTGHHTVSRATKYVSEGDSVTLQTDVETNQQEDIRWHFNDILIAEITGDLSYICTDVQCNNGTERFRDRLKLDHQTGSLTITNIRTRDSGLYLLQISSSSGTTFVKYFYVNLVLAGLCVATDQVSVSVMEKGSVTLHTDVKMNQQEKIVWYFNGIRIAVITGDLSYICTEFQCNEETERFRDRLKLDRKTGSLIITDIRTNDSGHYYLRFNHSCLSGKRFIVAVTGAETPGAEMKRKSVKEGESVTLDPGEIKKTNDVMKWYFNETFIAEISEENSKICTDVQCEDADKRFRDRLEVNHHTGSLTITNTRTTDSGLYKLQISSRNSSFSISRFKSFGVNVTAVPGLSSAAVAGICAAAAVVLLLLLFCCCLLLHLL
uniref:Uncharacterized protein n=1 Tax=Cyprinus carpio carpio TaxID=630221 RepID=A0A8C1HZH7_CYPCA